MTTLAITRVARPARRLTKPIAAVAASIVIGYALYRILLDAGTPFVLAAALAFSGAAVSGHVLGWRASLAVLLGGLGELPLPHDAGHLGVETVLRGQQPPGQLEHLRAEHALQVLSGDPVQGALQIGERIP